MESNYVRIAGTQDIPVGKMKALKLESKEILITNVDGNYFAIGNRCAHAGGDLAQGTLEGNIVTCPRHHAKYDVTTGKVVSNPKVGPFHPKVNDEPNYQVKIENDNILVKL
jgi:3-phenylpropionate/trans-cinnamate dioxygenase ferredoxin subunit